MAKKPVKAVDWNKILQTLQNLEPAVAAIIATLVNLFANPAPTYQAPSSKLKDCCPCDLKEHLQKMLDCQQQALIKALFDNLGLQHHLEECCQSEDE